MSVDFSDERISAYLDGELTPAERAEIDALMASSPEHRQLVDELRALRASLQELPRSPLADGFTQRVMQRAIEAAAVVAREGNGTASGGTPAAEAAPIAGNVQELALRQSLQLRRWRQAFWSVSAAAAGLLGMLIVTNSGRLAQVAVGERGGMENAPQPGMTTDSGLFFRDSAGSTREFESLSTVVDDHSRGGEVAPEPTSAVAGADHPDFKSVERRKQLGDVASGEVAGIDARKENADRALRRANTPADEGLAREVAKGASSRTSPTAAAATRFAAPAPTPGMPAPGGFGGLAGGGPSGAPGGALGRPAAAGPGGIPPAPGRPLPTATADAAPSGDDAETLKSEVRLATDKKKVEQSRENPVYVVWLALTPDTANPAFIQESLQKNDIDLYEAEKAEKLERLQLGAAEEKRGAASARQAAGQVLQVRASRQQAQRLIDTLRNDGGDSTVYPLNTNTFDADPRQEAQGFRSVNREAEAQRDQDVAAGEGRSRSGGGKPQARSRAAAAPAQAVVVPGLSLSQEKRAPESTFGVLAKKTDRQLAKDGANAAANGIVEQRSDKARELQEMVDLILVIDVRREAPKPPPTARPSPP